MVERLDVLGAVRQANRVWLGWPVEVCAPLLVLNMTIWTIGRTMEATLARGLYLGLFLMVSAIRPLVQEWLSVIVLRVGFLRGAGDSSPVGWMEVLGLKRLKETAGALYLRYVLWAAVSAVVVGVVWFFGLVVWFIVHGHGGVAMRHGHHPTLIWISTMSWIMICYLLLSRYMFVLPLIGIEGSVREDAIRIGVRLANGLQGTVVGVALMEVLLLTLPLAALLHFMKPVVEPVRFAYGTLELVTTVVSALLAAWFVLVKLDLARQALRLRNAGESV